MNRALPLLAVGLILLSAAPASNADSSRLTVPDANAQTSAEATIKSIFASDYSRHTSEARRQLASKLLNQAGQTNNDMAGKYVLFREARDLAVSAGDVDTALAATDGIAAAFNVDTAAMKVGVLSDCARTAVGPANFRTISQTALNLAQELGERRADLALHAAGIAETAARRAKTLDLALAAQNLMADLQRRRDEAKTLSAAADRLKTNPADGEANLVVGEDFCFRQRRWDLGLPLIARGNDPVLKALAERDLASPSQQGDEIALGNDWWDLGRKQIGAKKSHFLARGYLYLKRALPQAQDLQRLAIEKRLAEAPFVGEAPGEAARFTRNSGGIWAVQFTPDGRYALSAGEDCMIRMWDILTGREIRRFEGHTSAIMRLSVALTGHLFVSGSHDHTARVWDLDSGHEVHRFEYGNDVNAAVISPDGKLALIADNMSAQRLFDSATGKPAANFAGEGSYASAWSSGGRCFASGGWDRFANVFDAHTLKQLYHLPQGDNQVYALALSVDGRRLLSSGPNRIIRFWDLDHGTEIRSFEGSAGSIRDLAISPDNRYALAAGAESQLRVWDLFAGGPAREFEGHTDAIHGVCFSPDGRLALTGSADGTARVWRLPDPN